MIVTRIHDATKRPVQIPSDLQTIGSAPLNGARAATKEEFRSDSPSSERRHIPPQRRISSVQDEFPAMVGRCNSQSSREVPQLGEATDERIEGREAMERSIAQPIQFFPFAITDVQGQV